MPSTPNKQSRVRYSLGRSMSYDINLSLSTLVLTIFLNSVILILKFFRYCEAPASVAPYEWPDDITKWPICRKTIKSQAQRGLRTKDKLAAEHMVCEVCITFIYCR